MRERQGWRELGGEVGVSAVGAPFDFYLFPPYMLAHRLVVNARGGEVENGLDRSAEGRGGVGKILRCA